MLDFDNANEESVARHDTLMGACFDLTKSWAKANDSRDVALDRPTFFRLQVNGDMVRNHIEDFRNPINIVVCNR